MSAPASAFAEWRRFWYLPFAAGLGYSMAVLQTYAMGPFIGAITQEFGWSRTEMTLGVTIANLVGAALSVVVGLSVDRFGPRHVGLVGVATTGLAFALFGTTSSSLSNWLLLWCVFAVLAPPVQAAVWSSAVASRFQVSRGLAFGIMLSGASLAATLFPPLSAYLIQTYGWRTAFMALGGGWAALVFIALLFFFRSGLDAGKKARDAAQPETAASSGVSWAEGLRMPAFYKLMLVCLLYTVTTVGFSFHFVPILGENGVELLPAAGIASLLGIFAMIGRLLIGLLLDRFPGRFVGAFVFLFPIAGALLLLTDGANPTSQTLAAAMFGLALGAEMDVVTYLAARHFGLKNFGVLYGALTAALSIGVAIGPLLASRIYDYYNAYDYFLMLTIALTAISALVLLSLGRTPPAAAQEAAPAGAH